MDIGIFSRTYQITELEHTYQRMKADNICHTQLNLSNAGLDTLPDAVDNKKLEEIRRLTKEYGIIPDAISGTFNMVNPDEEARLKGCGQFRVQCRIASMLEIPVVSLCTGSRDPKNKWRWHEDNSSQASWDTLMRSTETILKYAQEYQVVLGVEPETANIVDSPQKARKYLDEFACPNLKIIMDGANLFCLERIGDMEEVLGEAFELLGKDIVLAHAKDIASENNSFGRKMEFAAAGEGLLDYRLYIRLLRRYGYKGPLIMHGLSEAQIPKSRRFLKEMIRYA